MSAAISRTRLKLLSVDSMASPRVRAAKGQNYKGARCRRVVSKVPMKTLCASALACCLTAGIVTAQQPEFDVATVKVQPPVPLGTALNINLGTYRNGSPTLNHVTLSQGLQLAYG